MLVMANAPLLSSISEFSLWPAVSDFMNVLYCFVAIFSMLITSVTYKIYVISCCSSSLFNRPSLLSFILSLACVSVNKGTNILQLCSLVSFQFLCNWFFLWVTLTMIVQVILLDFLPSLVSPINILFCKLVNYSRLPQQFCTKVGFIILFIYSRRHVSATAIFRPKKHTKSYQLFHLCKLLLHWFVTSHRDPFALQYVCAKTVYEFIKLNY
jgi:hypothetical protein